MERNGLAAVTVHYGTVLERSERLVETGYNKLLICHNYRFKCI